MHFTGPLFLETPLHWKIIRHGGYIIRRNVRFHVKELGMIGLEVTK